TTLKTSSDFLTLTQIPGLGDAVNAISEIIGMIAQRCEKEQLSPRALKIPTELKSRIKNLIKFEAVLLPYFAQLTSVNSKLHSIKHNTKEMRTESSDAKKIFGAKVYTDKLKDLEEDLKNARTDFELQGQIRIESLVDGMFCTMNMDQGDVSALVRLLIDKDVHETLDKLKPALEAGYRSNVHSAKAQHLEGTRVDLIREIYDWATASPNAPNHPIHILTGVAGAGKSTIASHIAKRLDDEGRLGASFFFDRGSNGLNTTHSVFTTLAYQLAQQQPVAVIHHFVDAARSYLQRGPDQQMKYALDELILRPLKATRPTRPVTLVIDALDECTKRPEELVPQVLRLLSNMGLNTDLPFRIFITSRPEYYIEEALRSASFSKDSHRFRLQDVPRHTVDADIQLYLEHNLEMIPSVAAQLVTLPYAIPTLVKRTEGPLSLPPQSSSSFSRARNTLVKS
ncbi:predicted protein, partial [Postia placenta Mad-698-R]